MSFLKLSMSIILLFITVSCTKEATAPAEAKYPVKIETIDGVKVITNPDFPRTGRFVLAFEEELNIGVEEGDENYMLSWPFDVKVADDGNIFVMDWKDIRIQVYDRDGKYLRTLGRKGVGPGEFDTPAFFDLTTDGRIFLMDSRHRRFSILDTYGNYSKGFRFDGFCTDLKLDANHHIYYEKSTFKQPNISGEYQEIERTKTLYRSDSDGQIQLNYGDFRGIKMMYKRTSATSSASSSSPYSHTTAWTVDKKGRLYAGYNEQYQLNVYDQDGNLQLKFGREFTPEKFEKYKGGANPEYWSASSSNTMN